jgi:integrase
LREALEALPRDGNRVFRFVNSRGAELTSSGVSQQVRTLAKRAGVRMSMKTLRAGFGCRYAAKVSAHVLQRLMRHASIKTTMDYYANIDVAVEEAVLGRKDGKRGPNVTPDVTTSTSGPSRPDASST